MVNKVILEEKWINRMAKLEYQLNKDFDNPDITSALRQLAITIRDKIDRMR